MKTTLGWTLRVGLALTSGLTGLGHADALASSETSPAITIHVKNYAGVAQTTLAEGEEVATGIFRNAGIETRWADLALTSDSNQINSPNHPAQTLVDIQLSIFPRVMSDRNGLPDNVMGLAPGNGPDRKIVYVFDRNVEARIWWLLRANCNGCMDQRISKAQILGHVMAHEVGHLLLNQQIHSPHGIMRGEWSFTDYRDMTRGMLLFTLQQAEVLRADVRRRDTQQEIGNVAGIGSPASPH
jgi:hypothetical protein